MWRTSIGDRVLEGSERSFYLELVQFSLDLLIDLSETEVDLLPLTGDRSFDSATLGQRIILLSNVLSSLLEPNVEISEFSNLREAAAYFPFAILLDEIETEIELSSGLDRPEPFYWCKLFQTVFTEYFPGYWDEYRDGDGDEDEHEDEDDLAELAYPSTSVESFESIIDCFADRIFWDRDWQASYYSPQILEGVEPEVEAIMGYGDDYFTVKLPRAAPAKVKAAIAYIRSFNKN